jgi:membrane protease YdiL (CAAX protease family)
LFWRGVVLPELSASTSVALGAVLAWAAWVAVDATWGSIPLLAGAVVGGALWAGLATWSGRGGGSRREPSGLDRAHARVAPSSGA